MTDALDFPSELEDLIQDYLWWGVEGSHTLEGHEALLERRQAEIIQAMSSRIEQFSSPTMARLASEK